MTFLDTVNSVLRRMRKTEVTTVSSTKYSKMVGDYVNDAKQFVELAWDWSQLRQFVTETTTSPIVLISDWTENTELESIQVGDVYLERVPIQWINDQDPKVGAPQYYAFNSSPNDGSASITLYPTPSGSTTVKIWLVQRDQFLTADEDVIRVPHMPVIHLAVAMLARERGETGGTSVAEYFTIADRSLGDAIAVDALKQPEKLQVREV